MKTNITIKQIALESNVSMATVSRYLNGTVTVSDEKRQQIEAVIEKYHFTPNTHARSLSSGRTMTLGIVIPDISNPYFYSLFLEIQKEANQNGYTLLLYNTSFRQNDKESGEEEYFRKLIQHRVDGALVLGGQIDLMSPSPSYLEALNRLGESIPVVVMGHPVPGSSCHFLEPENGSGVTAVFHHLYSLGHREIAFLGGNAGVRITEIRLTAYRNLLSLHHLPEDPDHTVLTDYYAEDGYQAALRLAERSRSFTAVIAANDNVAIGAIRAFRDIGLSVPADISVASCDHFTAGEYSVPRITGIVRDSTLLGRLFIHTLLRNIKKESGDISLALSSYLLEAESCRPPEPAEPAHNLNIYR